MDRYFSYRTYLTSRFGRPVQRIPLNGGFSCPNRDGTISSKGCIFCDNRAFSPAANNTLSAPEQFRTIVASLHKRYTSFIAYLQPFSNTYGDVRHLKSVYEPLLAIKDIAGLAIGTRPDCFTKDIYDYLADVSQRTYLAVELGLQSGREETLRRINRGHTVVDFEKAVDELARRNIYTVAHVILGFAGENEEMMMQTARRLAQLPVGGVKIHQLMIVKNTGVEEMYHRGEIHPLELDRYAYLTGEFLQQLRPDQHIHRLMADSKKEDGLIEPAWCLEKTKALRYIHDFFDKNDVRQGANYGI